MGGWVGKENEGYGRKTTKTALVLSLWDEVVGNEGVGSGGEHTTGVVPVLSCKASKNYLN